MSRTDLISDGFTIIRNGTRAKKEEVYILCSKPLLSICEILKREGYVDNFKEIDLESFKKIKVYLKYEGKKSVISQIERVSTPGRRVYAKRKGVPITLNGYGVTLVSTSEGIITDKEAKEKGIGGEVMGRVW